MESYFRKLFHNFVTYWKSRIFKLLLLFIYIEERRWSINGIFANQASFKGKTVIASLIVK